MMNSGNLEDGPDSKDEKDMESRAEFDTFARVKLEADQSTSKLAKLVGSIILFLASFDWKIVRLPTTLLAYLYLAFVAYQKERKPTRTTVEVAHEVYERVQVSEPPPQPLPFLETTEKDESGTSVHEPEPQTLSPSMQEAIPTQLDPARSEVFLTQMREETIIRNQYLARQMTVLEWQRKIVFWVLLGTGIITVVVAVVGITLLFNNHIILGVVTEGVGLFPGVGTLILFRISNGLTGQARELNDRRDENFRALQSINVTLLIPDPTKRAEAIYSLSVKLLEVK